jgi:hypothetical protein
MQRGILGRTEGSMGEPVEKLTTRPPLPAGMTPFEMLRFWRAEAAAHLITSPQPSPGRPGRRGSKKVPSPLGEGQGEGVRCRRSTFLGSQAESPAG